MNTQTDNPTLGLYDRVDRCWIGNATGPLKYTDTEINGQPITGRKLAALAAYLVNERCGYADRRVQSRIYHGSALTWKDEITPPLSTVDVLTRLEAKGAELAPVFYRGVTKNGHLFETEDRKTQIVFPALSLAMETFGIQGREYHL